MHLLIIKEGKITLELTKSDVAKDLNHILLSDRRSCVYMVDDVHMYLNLMLNPHIFVSPTEYGMINIECKLTNGEQWRSVTMIITNRFKFKNISRQIRKQC